MTTREAYVFGWMFGAIQRADKYSDIGGDITIACQRPHSASARIITTAQQKGLLRGELDMKIMEAMAEIESLPEMDGGSERFQPLENQSSWQMGYYAGKAGRPLADARLDIAAARKGKGLTQAQLAELMGVDQAHISRWESGKVAPSAENLEKLSKLLR